MHTTAVTASRSVPTAAGQLSVRTMASCYNCCVHSLPGPIVPFVLVNKYLINILSYLILSLVGSLMINYQFMANLLLSVPVKESWKSINVSLRSFDKNLVALNLTAV